jgi:hypothetical protein
MLPFMNRAVARMLFISLSLAAAAGHAQTVAFPGTGWLPLTQAGAVLDDPFDGGLAAYLDVVGDRSAPGAFVASDANYLYLRLRVADSPWHTPVHHYYASLWACLFDIDQDPQTYELLAGLDGIAGPNTVDLDLNTSTTTADDVSDPADTPPLITYDAALNAQYEPAGSAFGGATDYFVDWALAWNDLKAGGMPKGAAFRLVCGTSTDAASLTAGDVLDVGSGSRSFSADVSAPLFCDDNGCFYDTVFSDGFEGP